jgi:nicotinate-nucleotide adenylyltransferase
MTAPRIGLFGGTFDPPHIAHVVAAAQARWCLDLPRVVVVPAGDPWQKSGVGTVSDAVVRLEMARAAFSGLEGVEVSDIEIGRSGPSYTIDTVNEIATGGEDVVVIVGRDTAAGLADWDRAEELRDRVTVAVFDRPGYEHHTLPEGWTFVHIDMPALAVSSTLVHGWKAEGRHIDGLVPPAVMSIVEREGLYREPG